MNTAWSSDPNANQPVTSEGYRVAANACWERSVQHAHSAAADAGRGGGAEATSA